MPTAVGGDVDGLSDIDCDDLLKDTDGDLTLGSTYGNPMDEGLYHYRGLVNGSPMIDVLIDC